MKCSNFPGGKEGKWKGNGRKGKEGKESKDGRKGRGKKQGEKGKGIEWGGILGKKKKVFR